MREVSNGSHLVTYLVAKMNEKYPNHQLKKFSIQRLMYLFEVKSKKDFDYKLYNYGPYSSMIETFLEVAESLGFIEIMWQPNDSYFVKLKNNNFADGFLEEKEKQIIDEIVESYGKYTDKELFEITTVIYSKKNFAPIK